MWMRVFCVESAAFSLRTALRKPRQAPPAPTANLLTLSGLVGLSWLFPIRGKFRASKFLGAENNPLKPTNPLSTHEKARLRRAWTVEADGQVREICHVTLPPARLASRRTNPPAMRSRAPINQRPTCREPGSRFGGNPSASRIAVVVS